MELRVPLEDVGIRSVSDPTFPKGLDAGAPRVLKTDGVLGFYAGLGPILLKQVPYTMAKFAVQGKAAEAIYKSMGTTPDKCSQGTTFRSAPVSLPVSLPPSCRILPIPCCPRSTRRAPAARARP
ncbi:hypothetical protein DFJ74DRAFT_651200 [Hyaloraphidium curvatum]|nr:hypothetical protein DFJ74DRAFT_651200 [Hyaloraphidium curvatum]